MIIQKTGRNLRDIKRLVSSLVTYGAAGVFCALLFFQAIFSLRTGHRDLFFISQVKIALTPNPTRNIPLGNEELLQSAFWSVTFMFALITSFVLLFDRKSFNKFKKSWRVLKLVMICLLIIVNYFIFLSILQINFD
jgi:hypothetical protein